MKRTFIILLLFIPFALNATNYYVKNGGSDGANGLTDGTAWETIAKVNSSSFQPGDSILFKAGSIWRETLTMPSSGSVGSPIVIGRYGAGADPIIDGSALLTSWTEEEIGAGDVERETQITTSAQVGIFNYDSRIYVATDILAASTYALSEIKVNLTKVASPVMNINCYLYSDDGGNPTNILATSSTTLNAADISDGTDHAFAFDQSFTVVNGTTYWIVLKASAYSGTNYVYWNGAYSGGSIMNDADGIGTWTFIIGWHMAFRMKGYTAQFNAYYATGTVPNAAWEDDVYMAKKLSKTTLSEGSFYWDSGNNRIYVRTTGDADPTGVNVINAAKRDYGINSNDKDYFTIHDLTIRYTNLFAIFVTSNSNNVIINDCELYGNGFGVEFFGSYGLITRCIFRDGHMIVDDAADNNDYGAVGVDIQGTNLEISYCHFENLYAPSTDYGEDGGGIEIFQWDLSVVENITVHHNYFKNTSGLLEIGGRGNDGTIRNILYYTNISYDNRPFTNMISVHNGGYFSVNIDNIEFYNNTIISVGTGSGAFMWFASNPSAGHFVMRNNIIYVSNITVMCAQTIQLADHTYNLYYNPSTPAWTPGWTLGTGEIATQDPLFVNATCDFRLQSSSPAINAGIDVGLTEDYLGHKVPYNNGVPDIGAYEWGQRYLVIDGKLQSVDGKLVVITQ